jgi:hypothetical protein
MSKHTFTPGPWSTDLKIDCGSPHSEILGADGEIVAALWPPSLRDQANARLIAAAPELLEALEQIARMDYGNPYASRCADVARAAIARATGSEE